MMRFMPHPEQPSRASLAGFGAWLTAKVVWGRHATTGSSQSLISLVLLGSPLVKSTTSSLPNHHQPIRNDGR